MALTRRKLLAVAFLLLFFPAEGRLPHGGPGSGIGTTSIQNLNISGGGFNLGFDMASDGTMMPQVDIFGAYVGSTVVGTAWQQLVTQSAMPASYTSTPTPLLFGGAWAVKIDPTNSNNLWMMYCIQQAGNLTALLKSTNKGATWSTTGFPLMSGQSQTSSGRVVNGRIAINPNNGDVWASSTTDLYVSQDGGSTFTKVSGGTLPSATGGAGFVGMQFDPTTPNRMFVGNPGNGIYVSTNANLGASAAWTLISGSSTTPGRAKIASDGNYYFNNQAQSTTLWRIDTSNNLTSTTPTGASGIAAFAIDPNNPARVVTLDFGQINFGGPINGTMAWSSRNVNFSVSATDAPWQQFSQGPQNVAEVYFDPFVTTSATSNTIGTGTKTFTVSAGLNIASGDLIRVTNTDTPTNYMLGTASYSGTTLTLTVLTSAAAPGGYLGSNTGGSGTFTAWTITKERLWISTGFGMYWCDGLYTTTGGTGGNGAFVWNSQNFGMEDLVAREVIWPTGNVPVLANADKAVFQVPNNPFGASVGLSDFGPNHSAALTEGTAIDWASALSSTIFMVSGTNDTPFQGVNTSNGAAGSWTSFVSGGGTNPPAGGAMTIAAYDANNVIVGAPSAALAFTNNGGTSWASVTGASIPTTGWAFPSLGNPPNPQSQPLCADRGGAAATFYGVNMNGNTTNGIYKIVSGTATLLLSGALDPRTDVFAPILKCVPGNSGHLFYTGGSLVDATGLYSSIANVVAFVPSTTTYPFKFWNGSTLTALSTVSGVLAYGFGAAAAGQSYPSIYIAGWVSSTYGIWRCDTFNPTSPSSSCVWNNVGTFARGWLDYPTTIEGDPSQWGRFIIGHQGSGYAIGQVMGQPNSWP